MHRISTNHTVSATKIQTFQTLIQSTNLNPNFPILNPTIGTCRQISLIYSVTHSEKEKEIFKNKRKYS
jgi:hypothetical protein